MHRILEQRPIENLRVALRRDGAIWLLANEGEVFYVNRGSGWVCANRLRLCAADRIRVGENEISLKILCDLFGVVVSEASARPANDSSVPGHSALIPLSAPAAVIEDARRNPGTGQIEQSSKET